MVRLIETAAVPIMAVNASGNVNGWNSKAAELTGLAVDQAVGTPLVDLVDGDSVEVVKHMQLSAFLGIEERNVEIKLKTFGSQENSGPVILVVNACCSQDTKEKVVGVYFVGQDITGQKLVTDKYTHVQGDYVGITRNPSALIPPIFMTDDHGLYLEWNDAMENISDLKREEATERMLLGEVFTVHNFGCQVKNNDTLTQLRIVMNRVIAGQEASKLLFGFCDQQGKYVEALLSTNKRSDAEGKLLGFFAFCMWLVQKFNMLCRFRGYQNRLQQIASISWNIFVWNQEAFKWDSFYAEANGIFRFKQIAEAACEEKLIVSGTINQERQ